MRRRRKEAFGGELEQWQLKQRTCRKKKQKGAVARVKTKCERHHGQKNNGVVCQKKVDDASESIKLQ